MIQNYINHIVFVIDASDSMSGVSNQVVAVFDNQVKHLAFRSKELNQETRVSVYLFSYTVKCLIYDMDVMRLPSLKGYYKVNGRTALNDGTMKAIEDLQQTPQLYGDHAFLIYTLTDGQENESSTTSDVLANKIMGLPENWTLAVLVPNQDGKFEAKKAGFPADNISIWDVNSSKGIETVGSKIQKTTDDFMTNRLKGIRGTKSLFKMDVNLSSSQVRNNLDELSRSEYVVIRINAKEQIRDCVENHTGKTYINGTGYYQLTKPETIQPKKQICIKDKSNGKVYTGNNARKILGLPNTVARVTPGNLNNFDVFVQSTSYNRALVPGTQLIVLK
jgi:hypothetical protein